MRLVVGKDYRTRSGERIRIEPEPQWTVDVGDFHFSGILVERARPGRLSMCYREDGRCKRWDDRDDLESESDIVAEWDPDEKTPPQ